MRYITIYAVLNPTPKGVGYDLNVHFIYFRNPKFIAPGKIRISANQAKNYAMQSSCSLLAFLHGVTEEYG